ncbi:MAG: A24 family peptidase [Actinomycetota bacterium]|nr:A24 family peptidase [Actinomycetota bacterium]
MRSLLALVAAAAGLVTGCVLDAVVDRVPQREPVRPAVRCQFPATSKARFVHVACAALFAAAALRFGWSSALPAWLVLFAALLAISVIDLEHYIVPNRILIPLTAAAVPLLALAVIGDDGDLADFVRGLLGGVAGLTAMLVLNLISPRGMGMGDVKMSFVLGLYLGFLGWGEVVLGFFAAFLLGALVGLLLIALKRRGRKDAVPFGPFLAAGTVVAALWGEPILRWYSGA